MSAREQMEQAIRTYLRLGGGCHDVVKVLIIALADRDKAADNADGFVLAAALEQLHY